MPFFNCWSPYISIGLGRRVVFCFKPYVPSALSRKGSEFFVNSLFMLFVRFLEEVALSKNSVCQLDVRGFVHHSTVHKEKSNKMQQFMKILLFLIYMKLSMFRATHHPSLGA
jgi:hypothetical protein